MLDPWEEYHDLATLVRAKSRKNGDAIALRFLTGDVSYASLDRRSDAVASHLVNAGAGAGDRIAAWLFNGPEIIVLWFAVAKIGAIFVPLNTALKGSLLDYQISDAGPKVIVADSQLEPQLVQPHDQEPRPLVIRVGPLAPGGSPEAVPWADLERPSGTPPSFTPRPHDPAAILYTSGTTGPAKGVVLPQEREISTPMEIGQRADLTPDSVLFTALPLFHCNAQEKTALTAILNDVRAAFDDRFHASTFWETAHRFGATHASLLTSMVNVLYKQPPSDADRHHGVRLVLASGTPSSLWRDFERRFDVTILETYGMTECGCTTFMNPPHAIRLGSVGTPLGFVEADVVDDSDHPVPPNTRGELVVRPRRPFSMFLEYYRKPEATVLAWRNLWFHTGDFVTRDPDGYFYFVDRKKDVIRRRGENLAPYDVETALQRHPAVLEAVVVGVPSPLGEEDVKAFVQLKPGATASPRELFEFCARELPFFMVPRYLEFLAEIPKTVNEKPMRAVLRARTGGYVHDREEFWTAGRPSGTEREPAAGAR